MQRIETCVSVFVMSFRLLSASTVAITIDAENNISAFATAEEAAAATQNPFDPFASQKELAELAKAWPAERLLAIWNSLPGVAPVKTFKSAQAAVSRIWKQIQGLGEAAQPKTEPAKAKGEKKAKGGAQAAKGAPVKGKPSKKTTPAKAAPKAKKAAKVKETGAPREGSKTAEVVAMLQRKNGATLDELASNFKWERHTVRGMIAGSLKKAGYKITGRWLGRSGAPVHPPRISSTLAARTRNEASFAPRGAPDALSEMAAK
jgi:hypothetical protein